MYDYDRSKHAGINISTGAHSLLLMAAQKYRAAMTQGAQKLGAEAVKALQQAGFEKVRFKMEVHRKGGPTPDYRFWFKADAKYKDQDWKVVVDAVTKAIGGTTSNMNLSVWPDTSEQVDRKGNLNVNANLSHKTEPDFSL
jgi:hypothetical protein